MLKYNYTGAAALWDEYFYITCEPWTLGEDERQQVRREFMRSMTRGDDVEEIYIKYLLEMIEEARPLEDQKSKFYNFDFEREIESLIDKIYNFVKYGRIKK